MGYTYRYKVETVPADHPYALSQDLCNSVGSGIFNGDPIKFSPHRLGEEVLAFSSRWPDYEIRVWSVGG